MKKLFIIFLFLTAFHFTVISQTLTLETDNTGLPCHYMLIDVTANGFPTNVGAITLFIHVDGNVVQAFGAQAGKISPNVYQSQYDSVGISWSNAGGADINGLTFRLVLHYDGGSCVLDWNEFHYDITLTDLVTKVTCSFVNGAVSQGTYTFNTYYVDAAVGSSGDGLSWATAKKTITEATNLPLKPGEKVLIRAGTYNEKVEIKSDGGLAVLPQTGVILSDTNKITFPAGANLACVNLVSYPDQYYAYVYRSWSSNNGYYKITEVNDALNYVRVSGASFIPESGTVGNRGKVMAAVGRPVVYQKDPGASESQRIIVNYGTTDAFYIGKPISGGQTNADSSNWNIIENIDITTSTSCKGLHIQCSGYNVFAKGKIYSVSGQTGGIGAILTGTSTRQAKFNIIQNNEIYNTPYQGIFIGYTTTSTGSNFSHFNHILDNNIYLSGTSAAARFDNAIKIQTLNRSNVIESNNIHDIKIYTAGNGALLLVTKADSTLIYNNIFKNIGKDALNVGTNACIMIDSTMNKVYAYNNLIYNDDTVTNSVYAFRIYGRRHNGSKVCFNTIYKIDNAFYLQDNNANGATINFAIQNNIVSPTLTNINNSGTSGRFTVTYNLFRNNSTVTPYGTATGNIYGNPLFIDPEGSSLYGLMLNSSSPAMDTGTVITNLTRDYIGDVRGMPEPTLGAFENTMTCTWNGSVSSDWHNTLNWQYKYVPQSFMNIRIPNVANDPVISLSNAVGKSLILESGALLRIQSNKTLTLY